MEQHGSRFERLRAKIFGGANMFPGIITGASSLDVGERNAHSVKEELRTRNIGIVAQQVGGHVGRTVSLDTSTGVVTVKTAGQTERRY
jgi:chemotaxis protein CheD